jgi:ATP-binding cassette subfamily C protein LapB
VTFSYEGSSTPVVKNFNLEIKEGEKVAILGKIGSGKSTLSKLMLNLYQPQEGSILMDGINIKQIEPLDLRSNIGYVPQDVMLFNGTLKENITIGSTYFIENEKVQYILKSVGLDHIVTNNEEGLDMVIGERGDTLSGGEKQALSIARALVNYPSIMIFDEATKSMDSMSEKEIIKNLEHITEDKTTIIITHKPSMLDLVDRVIVVDNGRRSILSKHLFNESLKCIRCGACMNSCPIFRRAGGHNYNYVISTYSVDCQLFSN